MSPPAPYSPPPLHLPPPVARPSGSSQLSVLNTCAPLVPQLRAACPASSHPVRLSLHTGMAKRLSPAIHQKLELPNYLFQRTHRKQ